MHSDQPYSEHCDIRTNNFQCTETFFRFAKSNVHNFSQYCCDFFCFWIFCHHFSWLHLVSKFERAMFGRLQSLPLLWFYFSFCGFLLHLFFGFHFFSFFSLYIFYHFADLFHFCFEFSSLFWHSLYSSIHFTIQFNFTLFIFFFLFDTFSSLFSSFIFYEFETTR